MPHCRQTVLPKLCIARPGQHTTIEPKVGRHRWRGGPDDSTQFPASRHDSGESGQEEGLFFEVAGAAEHFFTKGPFISAAPLIGSC